MLLCKLRVANLKAGQGQDDSLKMFLIKKKLRVVFGQLAWKIYDNNVICSSIHVVGIYALVKLIQAETVVMHDHYYILLTGVACSVDEQWRLQTIVMKHLVCSVGIEEP